MLRVLGFFGLAILAAGALAAMGVGEAARDAFASAIESAGHDGAFQPQGARLFQENDALKAELDALRAQ